MHPIDAEEAALRLAAIGARGQPDEGDAISSAATSWRGGNCTLAIRMAARKMTTSGVVPHSPTCMRDVQRHRRQPHDRKDADGRDQPQYMSSSFFFSLSPGRVNAPGRQAMERASSSGYSKIWLKILGAISAVNMPPSAPPNDIHR